MTSLDELVAAAGVDVSRADWRTQLPKPAALAFPAGQVWRARMRTNKGDLLLRLRPDVAPMHVTSFAYLARLGFYDGLSFHRVITQFMAQGGCPLGSGSGGPGYRFDGEFSPKVKHDRPGLRSKPAGLFASGFDQCLVAAVHAIEVADRERCAAGGCWNLIAAVDDAHSAGIAALNGLRSSALQAGARPQWQLAAGFMPPS